MVSLISCSVFALTPTPTSDIYIETEPDSEVTIDTVSSTPMYRCQRSPHFINKMRKKALRKQKKRRRSKSYKVNKPFNKEIRRLRTLNDLIDDTLLFQSQMGEEEDQDIELFFDYLDEKLNAPDFEFSNVRDLLSPNLFRKLPPSINRTYKKLVDEEDRQVLRSYYRTLAVYAEVYDSEATVQQKLVPNMAFYLLSLFHKLLVETELHEYINKKRKKVVSFASQMYKQPHEITGEKPPLAGTMTKVYNEKQYGDHVKLQQKRLVLSDAAAKERRRKEAEESLAFFAG